MKNIRSVVRAISPFKKSNMNINNNDNILDISKFYWNLEGIDLSLVLWLFYSKHNPEKISLVKDILVEFEHSELDMLRHLCSKYSVSESDMQNYLNRAYSVKNEKNEKSNQDDIDISTPRIRRLASVDYIEKDIGKADLRKHWNEGRPQSVDGYSRKVNRLGGTIDQFLPTRKDISVNSPLQSSANTSQKVFNPSTAPPPASKVQIPNMILRSSGSSPSNKLTIDDLNNSQNRLLEFPVINDNVHSNINTATDSVDSSSAIVDLHEDVIQTKQYLFEVRKESKQIIDNLKSTIIQELDETIDISNRESPLRQSKEIESGVDTFNEKYLNEDILQKSEINELKLQIVTLNNKLNNINDNENKIKELNELNQSLTADRKDLIQLLKIVYNAPISVHAKVILDSYLSQYSSGTDQQMDDDIVVRLDKTLLTRRSVGTNQIDTIEIPTNIPPSSFENLDKFSQVVEETSKKMSNKVSVNKDKVITPSEFISLDRKRNTPSNVNDKVSAEQTQRRSPSNLSTNMKVDRDEERKDNIHTHPSVVKDILESNTTLRPHMLYTKSSIMRLLDTPQNTSSSESRRSNIDINRSNSIPKIVEKDDIGGNLRISSGGLISAKPLRQTVSPSRYMNINSDVRWDPANRPNSVDNNVRLKNNLERYSNAMGQRDSSPSVFLNRAVDKSKINDNIQPVSKDDLNVTSKIDLGKKYEQSTQYYRQQVPESKLLSASNENNRVYKPTVRSSSPYQANKILSSQLILNNDETSESKSVNDWKECFDSNRNRKYYYSPSRKQSVWKIQAQNVVEDMNENKSQNGQLKSKNTSNVKNNSYSEEYKSVDKIDILKQKIRQSDWIMTTDPKTRRNYWYNRKTRESSWTNPNENMIVDSQ